VSRRLALASLGLLLTTGCYKIDYVQGPSQPYPQRVEWHHIGIFGLVEFSEPVRLDQICPQGFARVHNERSVLNSLVTIALGTVGMSWAYSPYTVDVFCSSGQAYKVQVNEQGLATSAQRLPDAEPSADASALDALPAE